MTGDRNVLVIYAHPVEDSLAASLRTAVMEGLNSAGHKVDVIDLYADGFNPCLSRAERSAYADTGFDRSPEIANYGERLQAATDLVLVFPQWWMSVPAILKGFFDRVFVPGIAFDVKPGGKGYIPRLSSLRSVMVVTSAASPRWFILFVALNPLRSQIKRLLALCARNVTFRMRCLYGLNKPDPVTCERYIRRIREECARL